jgi:hypothetical protein
LQNEKLDAKLDLLLAQMVDLKKRYTFEPDPPVHPNGVAVDIGHIQTQDNGV